MEEINKLKKYLSEILVEENITLEDNNFSIGYVVQEPGSRGVVCETGQWFFYEYDDKCRKIKNGPYTFDGIIKVIAIQLKFKNMQKYKFTEEEEETYIFSGRYI